MCVFMIMLVYIWLIKAQTLYRSILVIICGSLLAVLGFGCGPVDSLSSNVVLKSPPIIILDRDLLG